MISLLQILKEEIQLVPRRSPEERNKNIQASINKKIQQYIKNGSKGNLDLHDTTITSLPDNLQVGGNLDLSFTDIKSLPDNLQVLGNIDLSSTKITSIPNNLKVGGDLDLSYTKITSIANNLQVDGNLYLINSSITKKYSKEQIKKMTPGIKGKIFTSWNKR